MTVSATTVTQYYTGIFRQAPSAAVSAGYQAMTNDNSALQSMLSAANLTVDPVVRLYQTAFNRLPDNAGMTAWVVPFSTGAITLQAIANGFTQSTEFTTLYPTALSNSQFVGALYFNILQRAGDDVGLAAWTNALNTGALTRAQVLLGFSESVEFKNNVEPKVNAFLTNIANTAVANQGGSSLYSGTLFDVNGGGGTGLNFVLTTNVDVVGTDYTSAEGTVTGTAATTSLNVFDSINMKAGQTTNFVTANFANNDIDAIDATVLPTLGNVQVLNLKGLNLTGGNTLNATVAPSLSTLNIVNALTGGNTLTVNNATAALLTIGMSNSTGITSPNGTDLIVNYASTALVGTSDAVTINLTNANAASNSTANSSDISLLGGAAGAGFETVNIVASSSSRTGAITIQNNAAASTMTTLNISGAGDYRNYGTLDFKGTAGTINASTATGAVTLTVGTEDITFTGGAGNDRLNFAAAGDLTAADSINFGAGTNTLGLADTTISTDLYTYINNTGAQKVAFTAGITADMSKITATTVVVDNDIAGNTFTKLAATDFVEVSTTAAGTATMNLTASLGFNTANINLAGSSTARVNLASVNLTSQATVNVDSVGTSGTANTLGAVTNSSNAVINVTGSGSGLTIASLSASASVNASAFTGALTVTGANAASSFTGGSGNDTVNLGTLAGGDTVVGGAGNDTITSVAAQTGTTAVVITGGTGADVINLDDANAAQTSLATLNTTAAESYATSGQYDTVNFQAAAAGENWTATVTTGVTTTSLAAASSVTVGTTIVTAGGFLWVNTGATVAASNANASLYQDSNSNGIIDATDLRIDFTIAGTDTLAVSIVGGKATIDMVGV